jgi:peptidoglycan/LPS O-acetylase OafA/YrhL
VTGVRPLGYRPGLDGLRALAVTAVLLYHAQLGWAGGGFVGVDVFFVLSGFLITALLLHERRTTGAVRLGRFWAARARRLLPAAVVVIVVALFVSATWHPEDLRLLRGDALASLLYVNNWHQVVAHRSYFAAAGRPSLLQHYWSLAVEEQFYLLWPPLVALGMRGWRRRRVAGVALAGAGASFLLMVVLFDPRHDPSRVYYGTDTRAMPILLGAALACAWPALGRVRPVGRDARALIDVTGLAGLAVLGYVVLRWHDYDTFVYRGGLLLVAVAAAALVAAAAHPASRVSSLLSGRPLVWLGRRSYGVYLWHWPVMALSRPDIDVHLSAWLLVPAQVAVTLALAEASYRWVEMPIRTRVAQRRVRALLASLELGRRALSIGTAAGLAVLLVATLTAWPVPRARVFLRSNESAQAATPATALRPIAPVVRPVGTGHPAPRGPVLAVGASVMLAAAPELRHILHATVDAKVGRQPYQIIARLEAYRVHHALPPVVVVQIGENGPFTGADARELRHVLRDVPRVVLMTLRYPGESWIASTNREIERLAVAWPQATLGEWHRASRNGRLLWDGIHPKPHGAVVYARVVRAAIDRN